MLGASQQCKRAGKKASPLSFSRTPLKGHAFFRLLAVPQDCGASVHVMNERARKTREEGEAFFPARLHCWLAPNIASSLYDGK